MTMKNYRVYSYDGFEQILNSVRAIIHNTLITVEQKDKIFEELDDLQVRIEETLNNRYEDPEESEREW